MSKHHLDHLSLTEFIFAESVQMLSFCDHCICLLLSCVLADSLKKCSEYVHVKKLCSFSSQSFFHVKIFCLLHAHEKLEQNQIIMKKEKEYLIFHLSELQLKSFCFHCHQQFLKKCDDKLIQENAEIFEKKLCVLKKKQSFIAFSDDNSSDLLISEINADTIFSALSDNF